MKPEFCNWKVGFCLSSCYNSVTIKRLPCPVVQTRGFMGPLIKGVASNRNIVDGSQNLKQKTCFSIEIITKLYTSLGMRKTWHSNKSVNTRIHTRAEKNWI